jgi:hypothetical protein
MMTTTKDSSTDAGTPLNTPRAAADSHLPPAGAGEPHPGVKQRGDEVGDQVDDHEHHGRERDDSLQHRRVLSRHRLVHHRADPVAPEHLLGDDRAAHQLAHDQRRYRYRGQHRGFHQVPGEQLRLGQAAGAGHQHVLLPRLVIKVGDQHLRERRADRDREGERREERSHRAVRVEHVEDVQLKGEFVDQQQANDEVRHGQEQGGERAQYAPGPLARQVLGSVGDHRRQDQRHKQRRARELQRVGEGAADQAGDRLVGHKRDAELAPGEARQCQPQLHYHRPADAVVGLHVLDLGRAQPALRIAKHGRDGVPRQDRDQDEREHVGQDDDDDRLGETLQRVDEVRSAPRPAARRTAGQLLGGQHGHVGHESQAV